MEELVYGNVLAEARAILASKEEDGKKVAALDSYLQGAQNDLAHIGLMRRVAKEEIKKAGLLKDGT